MDDSLTARLHTIGSELERRSLQLEASNQDIALVMQGLAATMEAIRVIEETMSRVDGLEGLGKGGD